MASTPFTRRTALRGLLSSVAAVAAQKAVGTGRSRYNRTKTVTTRTKVTTAGGVAASPKVETEVPATSTWLSGAADDKAAYVADGSFGRWRGEPVTYARIWADASLRQMANVWMMDSYTTNGWTGTLDVSCAIQDDEAVMVWTERGGPPVAAPPEGAGFGSKMVARSMSRQLGGSIAFDWSKRASSSRFA